MLIKYPQDLSKVIIAGHRLKLVAISPVYSEIIFKEFTDEITRYMVPKTPESIDEIDIFIQSSLNSMQEQCELVLVILKENNNEFLGVCGLHGKTNPHEPELGIWLKKSAHGHKYGQEAIKLLVDWTRHNITYTHLVYPCDKANIASRKIAENLNGSIFSSVEVKSMSGRILNEIVYKIV